MISRVEVGKKVLYVALLGQALAQINAGAVSEKGVNGLANSLRISDRHLRRIVKAKTGLSPIKLDQIRRMQSARIMLKKTKLPIVDIAFRCDFASLRRFNDVFKNTFNMTPREMRRNFMAVKNNSSLNVNGV